MFFSGLMRPARPLPGWLGTSRWRCPGRRCSRSRRHLAGPATGAGAAGGWPSRRVWAVVLLAACGLVLRRARARWWCRVADRLALGRPAAYRPDRVDVDPRAWPTARRSRSDRRQFADHRPRLRGHLDDVRQHRRRWAASRCPRSPSSTAAPTSALGLADLSDRHVERLGTYDPHRHARRDDDPAGAAARAGVRRPVRAAPPRPDHPGRGRASAGRPRRRRGLPPQVLAVSMLVVSGTAIFFGALHGGRGVPVLDGRRLRGRQRVHLRRQHAHAVPAHDLPREVVVGADLRRADRLRQLVPLRSTCSTGRTRSGCPTWLQFAARRGRRPRCWPPCAWRTGVRHYTSTGS